MKSILSPAPEAIAVTAPSAASARLTDDELREYARLADEVAAMMVLTNSLSPRYANLGKIRKILLDRSLQAPAASGLVDHDHEVMFTLKMSCEHDERRQALALRTWLPAIERWYNALRSRPAQGDNRDAERLDYLERVNPIIFHKSMADDRWEIVPDAAVNGNLVEGETTFCGDTLREAIDAAMSQQEGK